MKKTLIILICISALAVVYPAHASPNKYELRMYRTLVADYSKTSGGSSPALSPDGKILAFMSNNDIWIRQIASEEEAFEECKNYEPWKLEFKRCSGPSSFTSYGRGELRSLDWSLDGKKLVIAGPGCLYLAENFDLEAKKADVHVLDVSDNEKVKVNVESPRWSPDGKMIAVILPGMDSEKPSAVIVVNADTAEKKILAEDADKGPFVWVQPWSPDGKYLIYTSYKYKGKQYPVRNLNVVSVDGKTRWQVTKDGGSSGPSWSPKTDQIIFVSRDKYKIKYPSGRICSSDVEVICIADSHGANRRKVSSPRIPSKEELAAEEAEADKRERQEFEKKYGPRLTPNQLTRLRNGKMEFEEMQKLDLLFTAREMGGDLQKKIESVIKIPGKKGFDALVEILSKLPSDKCEALFDKTVCFIDPFMYGILSELGHDALPTWSPDGKKIAFVRGTSSDDIDQVLFVTEIASGIEHRIFSTEGINCINWANKGKSLIIESKRSTGWRYIDHSYNTMVCYPEIWLLELRQ